MRLILVRHGETPWNRENRIQGHTDIELSDYGRLQVRKLALAMQGEKITAIYSSPLKRAYETARTIAGFHHLDICIERDLQELNHGDLESLTIQELKEKYGELLRQWIENPASVVFPNAESLTQLQERTWEIIRKIVDASEDTLVVSHGMAIMTILCRIQDLDLTHAKQMFVNMASKTVVEFSNGCGTITLLNDTSHLDD